MQLASCHVVTVSQSNIFIFHRVIKLNQSVFVFYQDTVVTNDRWGKDTLCKHGGYLTCSDHYDPGVLQPRKWENCITIDTGSWGFRRNADLSAYRTIEHMLQVSINELKCLRIKSVYFIMVCYASLSF